MFTFLICMQLLAIFMCLSCFVLTYRQKQTSLSRLMMLISLCALVENAGYLLEMLSKDVDSVMMALRMEYLGAAFVPHFNLIFSLGYCKIKPPKWVKILTFGAGVFTIFCVWTYKFNHLYYTSVSFVNDEVFSYVKLGKGPYYIAYAVLMYIETIMCMVLMLKKYLQTKEKYFRRNAFLMVLASGIPLIFHALGLTDFLGGYDMAPFGIAVSIGLFGIAIGWMHMFDIVEVAYEKLFESTNNAIIIVNTDMEYENSNGIADNLIPSIKNMKPGQHITDEAFLKLIKDHGAVEYNIANRFYDISVNDVYSGSHISGYALTFYDITEHIEQLKKMEELKKQADSANEAKSAFLANVSHEIRTPINAVLGLNEVILRDYNDPKLIEYSQSIQSSAGTLLNLINQLLDFSKIESGKMTVSTGVYDARKLFNDLCSVNRFSSQKAGLDFIENISDKMPQFLNGDENRIGQVVTNLLSNAIKYTEKGSVSLRVDFDVINDTEGKLIIEVSDTGIGIRKEELDKLFDSFVRLDESRNRNIQGTGLGLNITRNFIEMMNGELKVESEYGKGTKFIAIIPQKCVDESTVLNAEGENEPQKWKRDFTAPEAKVLIVDDSRVNLKVASALLRPTLAKVTTADSGAECLDMVSKEHFDVIFLDHRMPLMDGVETLENLKHMDHKSKDAKVIALTANVVNDAKQFYLDAGFDGFLAKPVSEEAIDTMLKNSLDEKLIVSQGDVSPDSLDM